MNKKVSYLLIAIVLLLAAVIPASAQMGIGTSNPDPSAALDIVSTDQGVLHPRLTTAQRDAIGSPAEGLTIYNTTDNCLQVYDGSAWSCAVGGSAGGSVVGSYASGSMVYVGVPRITTLAAVQDWIDDDTFVIVSNYTNGGVGSTPYDGTFLVQIYNADFAEQSRFTVPAYSVSGWYSFDAKVLSNGNLAIVAQQGGSGTPVGLTIVELDGTVLLPWATTSAPIYILESMFNLDDGKFVTPYMTTQSPTYASAGFEIYTAAGVSVKVVEIPSLQHTQYMAFAPTSFGFAVLAVIASGSWGPTSWGSWDTMLYTYDFGGNLLGSSQFESATANPFASVIVIAAGSVYLPELELAREDGDILYASAVRTMTSNSDYETAIRKFQVNSDATFTTQYDQVTAHKVGQAGISAWRETLAPAPDGSLVTFGAKEPDILFDSTPQSDWRVSAGQSLRILGFDSAGSYTGRTTIVQDGTLFSSHGMRSLEIPWANFSYGAAGSNGWSQLAFSPSGTNLFVGYYMSANVSDSAAYSLVLDPATMAIRSTSLQANNQPQDLRKEIGVAAALDNLTKVEITITDGAGTFDAIACSACGGNLSANYAPAAKKLTITNASGTALTSEFNTALRWLTFSPDSPAGTRTFEVAAFTNDGQSNSVNFTVDVSAP